MLPAGIDVLSQFERVTDFWSPKVIAQVNDQYIKIAKIKGTLTWHSHDSEDELFWILRGRMRLEFEDRVVELGPGECYVVPRGVPHNPVADEECWLVLVEPVSTLHTGEVQMEKTRSIAEQLA